MQMTHLDGELVMEITLPPSASGKWKIKRRMMSGRWWWMVWQPGEAVAHHIYATSDEAFTFFREES